MGRGERRLRAGVNDAGWSSRSSPVAHRGCRRSSPRCPGRARSHGERGDRSPPEPPSALQLRSAHVRRTAHGRHWSTCRRAAARTCRTGRRSLHSDWSQLAPLHLAGRLERPLQALLDRLDPAGQLCKGGMLVPLGFARWNDRDEIEAVRAGCTGAHDSWSRRKRQRIAARRIASCLRMAVLLASL
jgi:hypothetical protein